MGKKKRKKRDFSYYAEYNEAEKRIEKRSNIMVANSTLFSFLAALLILVLNEIEIFHVEIVPARIGLTVAMIMAILPRLIVNNGKAAENPKTKYIIMSIVVLCSILISMVLYHYAVLILVYPLFVAMSYHHKKISHLAEIGAFVGAFVCPILNYFLKMWDGRFLEFIYSLSERAKIYPIINLEYSNYSGALFSKYSGVGALKPIIMYLSIPNALIILGLGALLNAAMKGRRAAMYDQIDAIMDIQNKMLYSVADIVENRDASTGGHIKRTSDVVKIFLETIEESGDSLVTEQMKYNIIKAAPVHDIGKITIDDDILCKPGKLTFKEYEIIKTHAEASGNIIKQIFEGIESPEFIKTAYNIGRYHHERYDGNGYPEGLKAEEIPIEARIMAYADVYDALVSERCYKEAMDFTDAFNTIEECMGTQFDPNLNKYFLECHQKWEAYYAALNKVE